MIFYGSDFFKLLDKLTEGQLSFYLNNPNLPAPLPDDPEQCEAILKMRKAIDDFHTEQKKILPEYYSYVTKNVLAEIVHQNQKDKQEKYQ